MHFLILSFIVSFLLCFCIVRFSYSFFSWSLDIRFSNVQKIHTKPIPRIGGLAIFIALIACFCLHYLQGNSKGEFGLKLLVCSLPLFASGLLEDVTKAISPRVRLLDARNTMT